MLESVKDVCRIIFCTGVTGIRMVIRLEQFSEFTSCIYDAAVGVSTWEEVLDKLVAMCGGTAAGMLLTEPGLSRIVATSTTANPEAVNSYNDYYSRLDDMAVIIHRSEPGTMLCSRQVTPPPAIRHSRFFNEWISTWVNSRERGDCIATNLVQHKNSTNWLTITSPLRKRSFATTERYRLIQRLLPHFRQSLQIQKRLGELQLRQYGTLEILARLAYGAVLLSQSGRVVFINPAAETLLRLSDGLSADKTGYLHTCLINESLKLKRMIGAACQKNHDGLRSGGNMLISRPSCKRAFLVHTLPLGNELPDLTDSSVSAMLLIVDPENAPEPLPATLHNLFDLTAAEAKVALQVIKDEKLQDVADRLSISLSTVRTHLQHVFEKTGTHRQADLARLLLTLHAGIDIDTNLK